LSYYFPPILTQTDNLQTVIVLAQRLTIASRDVKTSIQ